MNCNIYYAHHMWKYGTNIEKFELDLIHTKFKDSTIINPNGDIDFSPFNGDIEKEMEKCYSVIKGCDAVVFSSLSGIVGRGVVGEVNKAIELGKNLYYLENDTIKKVETLNFKLINRSNSLFAMVANLKYR